MKRKLMLHGETSLTVTLPKKWIAIHKLKKGDEVGISEDKGNVIISSSIKSETKKGILDTNKLGHFNKNYLNSMYKAGYDEITVLTSSLNTFNDVQERVANMIGYEIFDRDKSKCIIKSVAKEMPEEFDTLFRKAFLVTLELADAVYQASSTFPASSASHDKSSAANIEELKQTRGLEQANNKFTELCARILYKHGFKDQNFTLFIYCINRELEKIADRYKYIADFIIADSISHSVPHSIHQKPMMSKETRELFRKTNEYLRTFYKLFYKFDASAAKEHNDMRYTLISESDRILNKTYSTKISSTKTSSTKEIVSTKETVIVCYLREIIQLIYELHNPYLSMVF